MTRDDLLGVVTTILSDACELREPVDADARLSNYGLTSRLAAGFVAQLGARLGRALPQTLVWDHPTLNRIVGHLLGEDKAVSREDLRPLAAGEPIAIVGMACRFPGASDPESFWRLLVEAREAVGPVPAQRWDIERYFDADPEAPGRMSTKRGGFLDDVAGFDAAFFGISPREALEMDPQQRISLELAYEALERAGIRPSSLNGSRTGVFMGAMWSDYGSLFSGSEAINQYSATGRDIGIIANRISYALGTFGPSMTVDTACSASLAAVHLAVRSLRTGESRIALAGGVNLIVTPDSTIAMTKFGGMAPDGRSKAFDAAADGYVRGEGAGIVVLMPLRDALAQGLAPLALIRGTAINNDGPSNGLTAPNPDAQVRVIMDALSDARIEPAGIDYVEAHGTGTRLGDPIEAGAIGKVYGAARQSPDASEASLVPIGSVKTNIGHLEAAAGIAGLIKSVLVLSHRKIPATLHFAQPNPLIDFESLNLRVPTALEPCTSPDGRPLRVGVSSFGFGGANAHAIVEAWQDCSLPAPSERQGRPVVLVYSGNGGQWAGMGRDLLGMPGFDAGLAPLLTPMQALAGFDLRAAIADPSLDLSLPATVRAQLLTFAIQAGLARLLAENGIRASAVVGHSLGEIAAAYDAGILGARDSVALVYHRSLLQAEAAGGGAMASVELSWDAAEKALCDHPRVVCSGENAQGSVTISGPADAVAAAREALAARGVGVTPIAVDIAYHSPAMDPLAERLVFAMEGLRPADGEKPFFSTVTGRKTTGSLLDAAYFGRNLREPVRFATAFDAVMEKFPDAIVVEVGPHPLLVREMRSDLRDRGRSGPALASLVRGEAGPACIAATLQALRDHCAGSAGAPADRPVHVLALSARNEAALAALAETVIESDAVSLPDLCRAAASRDAHPARMAIVAEDMATLRTRLRERLAGLRNASVQAGRLQLMFTGAPVNLAGLAEWRAVDRHVDEVARAVESECDLTLTPDRNADGASPRLRIAAGALVGRLLRAWGIAGEVIGSGAGAEIAALVDPGGAAETIGDGGVQTGTSCVYANVGGIEIPLSASAFCQAMCGFAAQLWEAGCAVDWAAFDAAFARRRIGFPAYPFQHRRYWPETATARPIAYEMAFLPIADPARGLGDPGAILDSLPPRPLTTDTAHLDRRAGWYAARALAGAPAVDPGSLAQIRQRDAIERLASFAQDDLAPVSAPPGLEVEVALIDRVGDALPEILAGGCDPLTVLFPNGDATLLTQLYGQAPFGRGLAQWSEVLATRFSAAGARRFIEIGAGTGATSARILPRLAPDTQYLFTDVSHGFLATAQERFGDHDGFSTALLDIERSPDSQGVPGGFDVAVAVNVVHATRDLSVTLAHLRQVLRPGGLLVLGEVTGGPGWLDLVFGSLEGWWRFDDRIRKQSALLDAEAWRAVLAAHGFEDVSTRSDGDRQSLIIARAAPLAGERLVLGRGEKPAALAARLRKAGYEVRVAEAPPEEGAFAETWVLDAPSAQGEMTALVDTVSEHERFGFVRLIEEGDPSVASGIARAYALSASASQPLRGGASYLLDEAADAGRLCYFGASEDRVALSDGVARASRLLPLDLAKAEAFPVRDDAAYLVTGGLGALGLAFAAFLAERGARHLVLLGRNPPRASAEIGLARLRRLGVATTVATGDVADEQAIRTVIARLARPLAGIIHAAGNYEIDPALAIRPKIEGARALDAATADCDLDIMLLVSSAAGTWGSPDRPGYAAANAGLDAFARERDARGRRTLSIGFGRFSSRGLLDTQEDRRLETIGMRAMVPDDAFNAAWRIASTGRTHAIVADVDWPVFRSFVDSRGERSFFRALPGGKTQPRSKLSASPAIKPGSLARIGDAAGVLRRLLADALGYGDPASVPDDLGFFELGLDSLTAVRLRRQLEEALGRPVPATALFSYPTIARLAAYLDPNTGPDETSAKIVPPADADGPIAIIGIGCRFPGGIEDFESFGKAVFSGIDAIDEVPRDRWDWREIAKAGLDGELGATRWGGFLAGIDEFDAAFFSIPPREATYIDPQQRLLLETAWRAAEHGGLDPSSLAGSRTGVFVGMTGSDYAEIVRGAGLDHLAAQAIMGLPANTAAGRIAHTLGLQGPAIVVDTACSSSLTALHLACRSLAAGECDMALAGGVNLILSPQTSIILARAGMLSPNGRCRTFDAGADGFVRAEGCGMVLLKPLEAALADGDPVLAVIRGTAMNHDGRASGLTVPSGSAQEQVLRAAITQAGIDPAEIGYVELHGTGTALGDPIEASALSSVLCTGRTSPLLLGSFKTNIGHAESASGVGGLIRAIAALRARMVPPNLHFDAINPLIEDQAGALRVPTAATSLPDTARFAGVSGFGASGTNVHVLIEAGSPVEERSVIPRAPRVPAEFKRKRYWIEGAKPFALPSALPAHEDAQHEGLLYRLEWEEQPLPSAPVSGRWAIIGDDIAAGLIAAGLREHGIEAGINAAPDDIALNGIIALSDAGSTTSSISNELARLEALVSVASSPVFVIMRGAVRVEAGDAVSPGGAAVIALGRSLALRFPTAWGGAIDVAGDFTEIDPRLLASALAVDETELALRGSRIFSPRLARMDLPAVPMIATGATALVTGAFGGIGSQIVRSLFARGVRHFALIGRHPEEAMFAALVADGADIRAFPVDVADREAMLATGRAIENGLPPVAAIFHIAGARDGDWCDMLRPKLDGAQNLDAISAMWPVRHFVMFGSGASLWGDAGLGAYSAANGALRGVAHARRTRGKSACVVDYGPVAGGGMLDEENESLFQRIGLGSVDTETALDLALVLSHANEDGAVAAIAWPQFIAAHESRRKRPMLSRFAAIGSTARAPEPALPPRAEILRFLSESVATLTGGDPAAIDPDIGFMAMGLDSFGLMDLRRMVQAAYACPLSATAMFEAPTINRLADYLARSGNAAPAVETTFAIADEGIAIIGAGMRLPGGVTDLESLCAFLTSGRDGVGEPPAKRPAETLPNGAGERIGGWLDDVDLFAAERFRISPREALQIDPQHRLLLEVAWDTLKQARQDPEAMAGSAVGVFVGITGSEYADIMRAHGALDAHSVGGRYLNAAAGRISHFFGLTGPSLAIDTACSSSASAIHLAVQALMRGECAMALAGGANLVLTAETTDILRTARMLSPENRCRTFDEAANGYVRAEGIGLVLLKPLRQAEADGDEILAIIRGSAANHDGASGGFTVPNGAAQRAVIKAALSAAQLAPADICYVEAHGTGTALGDPIEMHALADTYGSDERTLLVGSIKSNIGHTEASAGVAGLMKLIVAGRLGMIPANLHFRRLNPHIDVPIDRVRVVAESLPWPERNGRRLAGLSAFGASGTNVHMLVEAPAELRAPTRAATAPAIHRNKLQSCDRPRIAFLFTGQGAQAPAMGRWLYEEQPVFRETLDRIAARIDPLMPLPLRALMTDEKIDLEDTSLAQPALFAFEMGLSALWRSRGIVPQAVLGHSLGEIAAAADAGMLDMEEAAAFVVERGRLMAAAPPGAMAAVLADEQRVRSLIRDDVEIAALNNLRNTVISGPAEAIAESIDAFSRHDIPVRRLAVTRAFHSALMSPILPAIEAAAGLMAAREGAVPLFSNLDGQPRTRLSAAYWRRQVRAPVAFARALEEASRSGCNLFLEIGPRPVLSSLGRLVVRDATFIAGYSPEDPEASLAKALRGISEAGAVLEQAGGRSPATLRAPKDDPPRRMRFWPRRPAPEKRTFFRESFSSPVFEGEIAIDTSIPGDWPEIARSGYFGHVGIHLALLGGAASDGPATVEDAVFHARLDLSRTRRLQRVVRADGHASLLMEGERGSWSLSSEARMADGPRHLDAAAFAEPQVAVDVAAFYASLAAFGLELGPELRLIERLARDGGQALATLRRATSDERSVYGLPASAYEAIAQVAASIFTDAQATRLVAGWDRLERSAATPVEPFTVRASVTGPYSADASLFGADGAVLVTVSGLTLAPLSPAQQKPWTGRVAWVPSTIARPAPGALAVTGIGAGAGGIVDRLRGAFVDTPDAPSAIIFAPGVEEEPGALIEAIAWVMRLRRGARLLIATCGTASPRPNVDVAVEAGAAIWGLARTLAHERADLHLRIVDLDPDDDPIAAMAAESVADDGEFAVSWRGGFRYVERLEPIPIDAQARFSALALTDTGMLETISAERVSPAAGEVEIAVSIAAANFRDVMVSKGLIPPTPGFGAECAGVITAVGAGVEDFVVGDAVVAYVADGHGAIRSHLTTPVRFVRRLSPRLAPARAGSCLLSVMIARRALVDVGGLRAGQTVFIHQACSAMGLAAIALARRLGAGIVASAHPEKHRFLQGLGVSAVVNSREPFAGSVRALSDGRGVDIAIGGFGRFVDEARDCLAAGGILLDLTRDDASKVDLDHLAHHDPQAFADLMDAAMSDMEAPELVLPVEIVHQGEAAGAFEALSTGGEIGRKAFLLDVPSRRWRSALVTGANGGVGRAIAEHLAQAGVARLALLDLVEPDADFVAGLRQMGCAVEIYSVDVADFERMAAILRDCPAFEAIIHAAAVLADCPLQELTGDMIARAFRAKVSGARVLDALTRHAGVDSFILCSSVTAHLPSAGQGAYAAANAALALIVRRRRATGFPGTALAWGPWSVGIGERLGVRAIAAWQRFGISPMSPAAALQVFDACAGSTSDPVVLDVQWRRYADAEAPMTLLHKILHPSGQAVPSAAASAVEGVATPRISSVRETVNEAVARVLGLPSGSEVDPTKPFSELGLDSLMASELATALGATFALRVSATLVYNHPTIEDVVEFLTHRLSNPQGGGGQRNTASSMIEDRNGASDSMLDDFEKRLAAAEQLLKDGN